MPSEQKIDADASQGLTEMIAEEKILVVDESSLKEKILVVEESSLKEKILVVEEASLKEKILVVEEASLDVADARIQKVSKTAETLETHDSECKQHVDSSELADGERQSTADDDMTTEEVNEYLQDLYQSEQDKDCENDDDDILLECEDRPNEFPMLLHSLQQLRQSKIISK